MSEPEIETSNALVVPGSGILVNLNSEKEVALAYRDLRELKTAVNEVDRRLREAMAARSSVLATKTFYIEGVGKVELSASTRVEYDAQMVEDGLRALDCPEDVIREIVVEQVTYKVDGNRARRAAAANPEYAAIIDQAKRVVETLPYISIKGS